MIRGGWSFQDKAYVRPRKRLVLETCLDKYMCVFVCML